MKVKPKSKTVNITHGQEITQSLNYQGAKAHYSVTLQSGSSEAEIAKTFSRAEKIVEARLAKKASQHAKFLREIAPK